MAGWQNREDRKHPRAAAKIRVEYSFEGTTGSGYTSDLSLGGLFLECDEVARSGMRIYLRLRLAGSRSDDPLKLIGVVIRTYTPLQTADAALVQRGMAVRFEAAYAETREQLAEFIEGFLAYEGTEPSAPRRSIRPLQGEDGPGPGFVTRLGRAPSNHPPGPTLRPGQMRQHFGFQATPISGGVEWGRLGMLAAKLMVLLVIIGLLGLFLGGFAELFSGGR